MGKRSKTSEVRPRDYWPTSDPDAVKGMRQFFDGKTVCEPCVGDGSLINFLILLCGAKEGISCDIEPQGYYDAPCYKKDALTLTKEHLHACDLIVTNPPFSWEMMSPLLDHFLELKSTWLLLPADFMHNVRSQRYMKQCKQIVTIGRLHWMDNQVKGKDNYCWFNLIKGWSYPTIFHGRLE